MPTSSQTVRITSPQTDGGFNTTATVSVSSSNSSSIQHTKHDRATTTTVQVSSSPQPTNNPSSEGTTTTSVIIVVAVVTILVVIVVGVVIFVVIFRTKKLEINKILNVMTEKEDIELKFKHKGTIEKEASSSTDQPPYADIQAEAQPNVLSKSKILVGYSEIELEPADSNHAVPAKPPPKS